MCVGLFSFFPFLSRTHYFMYTVKLFSSFFLSKKDTQIFHSSAWRDDRDQQNKNKIQLIYIISYVCRI